MLAFFCINVYMLMFIVKSKDSLLVKGCTGEKGGEEACNIKMLQAVAFGGLVMPGSNSLILMGTQGHLLDLGASIVSFGTFSN